MSINRVTLSGNLTREPELKSTQGGMQILSFGIAVNERHKNSQTGQWEDYANFVDLVMFGTRAEAVAKFLRKGMKVAVDGKLRYSSWENNGQKRSKLEVIVDEIDVMSNSQRQQTPSATTSTQAPQTSPQNASDFYDESIPF